MIIPDSCLLFSATLYMSAARDAMTLSC